METNIIFGFLGKKVIYIRCTVSEKLEIDHENKCEKRQETDSAKVATIRLYHLVKVMALFNNSFLSQKTIDIFPEEIQSCLVNDHNWSKKCY